MALVRTSFAVSTDSTKASHMHVSAPPTSAVVRFLFPLRSHLFSLLPSSVRRRLMPNINDGFMEKRSVRYYAHENICGRRGLDRPSLPSTERLDRCLWSLIFSILPSNEVDSSHTLLIKECRNRTFLLNFPAVLNDLHQLRRHGFVRISVGRP